MGHDKKIRHNEYRSGRGDDRNNSGNRNDSGNRNERRGERGYDNNNNRERSGGDRDNRGDRSFDRNSNRGGRNDRGNDRRDDRSNDRNSRNDHDDRSRSRQYSNNRSNDQTERRDGGNPNNRRDYGDNRDFTQHRRNPQDRDRHDNRDDSRNNNNNNRNFEDRRYQRIQGNQGQDQGDRRYGGNNNRDNDSRRQYDRNDRQGFADRRGEQYRNQIEEIIPEGPRFAENFTPLDENTLKNIRPVSYIVHGQRLPRRAVPANLYYDKIQKFFAEDGEIDPNAKPEVVEEKVQPEKTEIEEMWIEFEQDPELMGLTFKKRYYDNYRVCDKCFQVGHDSRLCFDELRKMCKICLDWHARDECMQISCFNCCGSGHKNTNCPLKLVRGPPTICHVCRKKGHLAGTCGIIKVAGSMHRDDLSRYRAGLENTFPGEIGEALAVCDEQVSLGNWLVDGNDRVFEDETPIESRDLTEIDIIVIDSSI
jgi:hypothetical protein